MHLYLYDSFVNDKRWASTLANIETRLTNLGIGGKIYRLSPLRNLAELINDEAKDASKTIVVVGNDKTVGQVVNHLARWEAVLGIIPLGPDNAVAELFGIPEGEAACHTLSARRVERIDLGKINTSYFLSNVVVKGGTITIECDGHYRVQPQGTHQSVQICNLRPAELPATTSADAKQFNPQDGWFEVFIQPEGQASRSGLWSFLKRTAPVQPSIIPCKHIVIDSQESVPVVTDSQRVLKTPVRIEVLPKKLRVIVGKDRVF